MVLGWVLPSTLVRGEAGAWSQRGWDQLPLKCLYQMWLEMRSVFFPFLPQSLTVNWENIILPTPLLLSPDRRSLCPPASMSRAAAPRAQCCAVPAVCPPRAQWDYALSAGTRGAVLSACCRRMIFLFSVCLQPFVPGLS